VIEASETGIEILDEAGAAERLAVIVRGWNWRSESRRAGNRRDRFEKGHPEVIGGHDRDLPPRYSPRNKSLHNI
jgi:hypothetical protein